MWKYDDTDIPFLAHCKHTAACPTLGAGYLETTFPDRLRKERRLSADDELMDLELLGLTFDDEVGEFAGDEPTATGQSISPVAVGTSLQPVGQQP
jgi:hypothetical protein